MDHRDVTIIVMTLGRIRIKSLPSTRLRRRRLPMMLRRVAPRKKLPDYGHQRQDCHNDGHLLSSVVRHVAQVGAFGAVVRHLELVAHPSSGVITPFFAPRLSKCTVPTGLHLLNPSKRRVEVFLPGRFRDPSPPSSFDACEACPIAIQATNFEQGETAKCVSLRQVPESTPTVQRGSVYR